MNDVYYQEHWIMVTLGLGHVQIILYLPCIDIQIWCQDNKHNLLLYSSLHKHIISRCLLAICTDAAAINNLKPDKVNMLTF